MLKPIDPVPFPVPLWVAEGISVFKAPVFMAACAWLHLQTPHPGVRFWGSLFLSTVPLELGMAQLVTAALSDPEDATNLWDASEGLCAAHCPLAPGDPGPRRVVCALRREGSWGICAHRGRGEIPTLPQGQHRGERTSSPVPVKWPGAWHSPD